MKTHSYLPSQPIVALAVGVAVGPEGLDVLRIAVGVDPVVVLQRVAWITVGFAVTSIALRLSPNYYREQARSLAAILGPGMVLMWLASSLVAYAALSVDPLVALLVGAVVTPTDPVLANSIVVGETAVANIPKRLRHLLSGEAGINDGTAFLFVFLPVFVLTNPIGDALSKWVVEVVLREIVGAVAVGLAVGTVVGRVERWESAQESLEDTSVFTITVALTFFVLGAVRLVESDSILGVFVAAVAYNWQADVMDEVNQQRVQEVFDRLFTIPVFVVFGMVLPWDAWAALGWRGPTLVVGVLLLRRLPMVVALSRFLPQLDRPGAVAFVGWFGPVGIAAVFYALLAFDRTGLSVVWTAGSLVVAGSVLAHGMTATAATHWYGTTGNPDAPG